MAAGDRVFLGEPGSDIVLDVEGTSLSESADTAAPEVGVLNEGTIDAAGGIIALAAAGDIYSQAISNVGALSTSVDAGNAGQIKLAAAGGEVVNTGTIKASGSEGGQVAMEGARVGQFGTVNADGTTGDGGNVNLTASEVVALSQGSLTTANAGTNGNGGEVIVYSPETALFWPDALIEAKGGTVSGDGGFIEVSGKNHVEIFGRADASATNGIAGTFLIDPTNITIAATPTVEDITDDVDGTFTCNADDNVILNTTIEDYLNDGTSVVLDTSDGDGGGGGVDGAYQGTGDITQNSDAPISFTGADGAATLSLSAENDIILNGGITAAGDTLGVTLDATRNVEINATIGTNGGSFSSSGVDFTSNSSGTITTAGGNVTLTHTGTVTVGANIDSSGADGGAINISGSSVNLDQQVAASNAAISVVASTGNIALADVDNIITAGNGDVTLTATAGDITVDDNTTEAAEIVTTGSVLLTANAIGNTGNKDLDLNGATALTIHDTGAGNIVINEQTESITSTDITVDNDGYDQITIDYFGTDNVQINDNHEIDTTTLDHDFSYTAGAGDITDKGAVALAGASSFTANGAGGSITLASLEADGAVAIDTIGNAVVTNDTALQLAASTVGGTLDVTATDGSISDTGSVAVAGAASFTANGSGGAITLYTLEANSAVTLDTMGNAAVTNDTALQLAASTVGGTLDAVATTGTITDTGALSVTGASSFTANGAGGAITLDTLEADGAVALNTVGSAAVTNDTALQLAASDIGGTLDATATDGSISDTDAVAVAGAVSFTANGSGGAITMDTLEADSAVTLDTVGNAAVTNDTALQLAASTVGGTLNAAATTGTITDTGALAITGAASFTADGAGGAIALDTLEADSTVALDTVGNAAVTNDTALELAASTVGGTLDAVATNGTITDTGALAITGVSSFTANGAGGAITLDTLEADGVVALDTVGSAAVTNNTSLQLAASTIGGTLDATATDGSISDTGAVAVTGAASFTANGSGGAITLDTLEANSTVTLDTVGNAAVTNDTALELAASNIGGTLDATATDGSISDTGAVAVHAAASFTANGAGGAITLDTLEADGAVALDTIGNAVVTNDTSLELAASNIGGTLDATATDGSISDTGAVAVHAAASFTANGAGGAITLNTLEADSTVTLDTVGNAAVTNDTALELVTSTVGGTLDAVATAGTITDTGALSITGASSFTANGAGGGITLNSLEADGAVALDTVGNAVVYNDTSLQLAASNVDGTLNVAVGNGSISDTGTVAVAGAASFDAVNPAGSITLDTLAADGAVALNAFNNIAVTNDSTLKLITSATAGTFDVTTTTGDIEIGGLLTSSDDMKLEAVNGAITQSAGTITTNLGSLTMKSEASLNMTDYTVSTPGSTDLILESTGGSAIVANSNADKWKSITATAENNIELQGTADIKLGGNLTSTSGGVSIISDDGTVITAGDTILDNVTITGNPAAGAGVDLPFGSGKAAIMIRTKDDLTLGSNAELIANGTYNPQLYDDRSSVGFDDSINGGADPIDVAIYLRSNRLDAALNQIGNVTVGSEVTIAVADNGTMVIDAGEKVIFNGDFYTSIFDTSNRLEVVSRRSETLGEVITYERLPHADDPEAIRELFNETSTGYFAGAYVLRGVKTLLAEVLALTNPVPLVPPRTLEPEFRSEVEGPDTEALEELLSELGIGVQPYVTEAYADSLSTDLRLYKAAEKLQELMPVLEDVNGIHIAGLREAVAEYFPTLDILSDERMDSFAQVVASHKGDGTDYDLAGQCIFALSEYINILGTDIGWPVETSVEFVMGRYVPRLTENDEIRIAVIQMHLQK